VLRALWARVEFETIDGLEAALARLDPLLTAATLRKALVGVRYSPRTLRPEAAVRHAAFAARHGERLSTWLPFCLPGSPNFARFGALATPPRCHDCIFYEARACQGLGDEPVPWAGLPAEPALRSIDGDVHDFERADFGARIPVAYWMPRRRHVSAVGAAVRAAGGRLWDIGGANGFLAGLLAADEGVDVTVIDRLDAYPTPPGVTRWAGSVRDFLDRPTPDALLISWPPTGDGFRDVVERLEPDVVIYAVDAEGFCGRRPGYAGVVARADGLRWFDFGVNDFAALPGRPRRAAWRVRCHRDLRAGGPPGGRLRIRSRRPLATPMEATPYAWEKARPPAPRRPAED